MLPGTKLALSDYAILTAGVPQGTKLGPITFQIIINDAACNSNTSCWKYVDDLTFAENRLCKDGCKMQAESWCLLGMVRNHPTQTEPCQVPSYSNMLYEEPTSASWP